MHKIFYHLLIVFCLSTTTPSFSKGISAKDTYEKYCSVCHATGLAGAPKFQSKDWSARCHEKKLKGLLANALAGINAMPAKGTCDICQQEDILAAIKYMVPKDENKCR
jgi:cytochrome c5